MNTRPTIVRLRIAILLGLVALFGGATVVSGASLLPQVAGWSQGPATPLAVGGDRARPWTFQIPYGELGPGRTVRGRQVIENRGGLVLRYAVTSLSTNDDRKGLRDLLHVTIATPVHEPGVAGESCERGRGAVLYDGPLGMALAGFGDDAIGQQPGDRLLAAGQREVLCFEITMPLAAGNAYQAASTSTRWTVTTEAAETQIR